jgi:hypothetical protein
MIVELELYVRTKLKLVRWTCVKGDKNKTKHQANE